MKSQITLLLILISLTAIIHYNHWTALQSVQSIASQFESQLQSIIYGLQTQEGLNMDCLKIITGVGSNIMGVFHSSKQQKQSGYSALYLAQWLHTFTDANWTKLVKLSERGSQGYIYHVNVTGGFLVLYQLENHQHGNTIAIRYYESVDKLKVNNFLYEYQLNQKIDRNNVRNIGTPSVDNVTFIIKQFDIHKSRLNLTLKFHYSPDGQKDLPGFGTVDLSPMKDFIDGQGQWKGGCKQNYTGWTGSTDYRVQQAIARLGPYSKIGQRDMFTLVQDGIMKKYYLYEVNVNPSFDWKDWRIVLYSEKDNVAARINFSFKGDEDVANPHISSFGGSQNDGSYVFYLTFFLPSEGVKPGVRAGEMGALVTIQP